MKITELRNNPAFLITTILLLVLIMRVIPIKEYLPFSDFVSAKLEMLLLFSIRICMLVFIISKLRIPHSYFSFINLKNYAYYLPAILFLFGGLSHLFRMSGSTFYSGTVLLYGAATLAWTLFEEILFRGAVLGVLLNRYSDSRNGILKSIVTSSLLFGLAHIVNIWTRPELEASYVTTQVFWAACLGVMYCAIYVKTRSLIVLGLIHFINNFAAGIDVLGDYGNVIEYIEQDGTIAEAIVSLVLTVAYCGLPLLIGLCIVKRINTEDVKELLGRG